MRRYFYFIIFLVIYVIINSSLIFSSECNNWELENPSWIWCDDFDIYTLEENYPTEKKITPSSGMSRSSQDSFSGNYSLQQIYSKGQIDAGWIAVTDREVTFPQEGSLFYRVYHKFAEDFEGSPDKLSRMRYRDRTTWQTKFGIHVWQKKNFGFLYLDTQMPSRWWTDESDIIPSQNPYKGKWLCIEVEGKLNTPGQNNGYHRLWIDNNEVAFRENMAIRGSYIYGFNEVMLDTYWNGGSNKDNNRRYYDNFVISTQRIGCLDDNLEDENTPIDENNFQIRIISPSNNSITNTNSLIVNYEVLGNISFERINVNLNDEIYNLNETELEFNKFKLNNLVKEENILFLELLNSTGSLVATSEQIIIFYKENDVEPIIIDPILNDEEIDEQYTVPLKEIIIVPNSKEYIQYQNTCIPNIKYGEWTQCKNNYQLREVIDLNSCTNLRIEKKQCEIPKKNIPKNNSLELLKIEFVENNTYFINLKNKKISNTEFYIENISQNYLSIFDINSNISYHAVKNNTSIFENSYILTKVDDNPILTNYSVLDMGEKDILEAKPLNFPIRIILNIVLFMIIFGGFFYFMRKK